MTLLAEPGTKVSEQRSPSGWASAHARTRWLDGLRGCAALFVVLHHMWLSSWPFFPNDRGPWFLGWLLYGHLGVAVFIVVSGYSLTLAPVRAGGALKGGARRFLRRRAWRILPAYWAALTLSALAFALLLQPEVGDGTVARSFLKFDVSAYQGVHVIDSNLALYSYWSSSCTGGSGTAVRRVTEAWTPSAVTWADPPASTTTGQVVNTGAKGFSADCPAGNLNFDIDAIVASAEEFQLRVAGPPPGI